MDTWISLKNKLDLRISQPLDTGGNRCPFFKISPLIWTKLFRINPVQDLLKSTVATYVFQIRWRKPVEIFDPLKANQNIGVLLGMSFLAYWKSLLTTRGDQMFWKSPQLRTEQTTFLKKYKISQIECSFHGKAHSLGQTHVCLGLSQVWGQR